MSCDSIDIEAEVARHKRLLVEKREELFELERVCNERIKYLQEICERNGHYFVAERDEDYHNTRVVYTCKKCDYYTRNKPTA